MSIRTRLNILFATFLVTSFAVGLISLIAVTKYARALATMTTFYHRAQRVEDLLALVYKQQQIEADIRPEAYELEGEARGEEVFDRLTALAAGERDLEAINRVRDRYAARYVLSSPEAIRDLIQRQEKHLSGPHKGENGRRTSEAIFNALFTRLDQLERLTADQGVRRAVSAVKHACREWSMFATAVAEPTTAQLENERLARARLEGSLDALAEAVLDTEETASEGPRPTLSEARRKSLVRLETAIDALRRSYLNQGERAVSDWGMTGFYAELIVGLAFLLIVAEMMAASFMVYRWVIRPLTAMSQAAGRIGSGDLDYRTGISGRDEVAHLAEQFDEMAAKLKQHQARLLEAKELATLGAISSSVAHGMRNPLAGIRASAQLLADRFANDLAASEQLRGIIDEVDRLSSRISRLVYLAKQSHLELAAVPASELLSAAAQEARAHLQARRIDLRMDDQTNGACVLADKDKVAQTLGELLSNAAHHSDARSTVTFCSRLDAAADKVCFTVADRGSGIDPQIKEQVFDLFYSTRPQGTGMGLACAKRIIEMHGGTIELDSEAGVGTTVRVRLPAAGAGP